MHVNIKIVLYAHTESKKVSLRQLILICTNLCLCMHSMNTTHTQIPSISYVLYGENMSNGTN
jgi:hypothetical protein